MSREKVIIGTRGSELALWQANTAAALIDASSELKIVKTAGDRFLDVALQGQADKGFFTKEIEELLLQGEIDVAVHSLKDLPTEMTPGLALGACLQRAPASDLLIVNAAWHDPAHIVPLRSGCNVGATSLRRQALLKLYCPQAVPATLRGNVPGRVEKCRNGEFGAIVLARAGLERLGLGLRGLHVYELDHEIWLPAPGQGAVAIQTRADDDWTLALLAPIDDAPTRQAVELERRLLANFEGGCHTAFGAWAQDMGEQWHLHIGLEAELGWVAHFAAGDYYELAQLGPASGLDLAAVSVERQEDLCRELRL